MRTIRLFGFAVAAAAIGCSGSTTTTTTPPPTTTPPGPSGSSSPSATSMFDALMAEAQGHVPMEGMVTQENKVADQASVGAALTDPHLLNAWGLAFNPAGPAWVSSNGNGSSQVYDDSNDTTKLILEVTIPPPNGGMPPSAPTGQVFNRAASSAFMGDLFIFATEDGTIAAWQKSDGTAAVIRADNSPGGAIYKGVAIAMPTPL